MRLLLAVCVFLLGSAHALAVPTVIGSTTMRFSASGSPNTIGGFWSADPIVLADSLGIDYFTFQLVELVSPFGGPGSISFDSISPPNNRGISLCAGVATSCIGLPRVGDRIVISPAMDSFGADVFLERLVLGSFPLIASGPMRIAYSSGGPPTTASGRIAIQAVGERDPVVVPVGNLLGIWICAVAGGCIAMRRRSGHWFARTLR